MRASGSTGLAAGLLGCHSRLSRRVEPAATQGLSCTGPAGTFSRRRRPCTAHWVRPTGPRCPRPPWCVHGAGHTLDVHMARLLPEQTEAASQLLGQTEWLRLQGTRNPGRDLRLRPAARPCQWRGAMSLGPRGVGAGRAPLLPSSAPLWGSTSSFISSFISSSMITFPVGQTTDIYRNATLVGNKALRSLRSAQVRLLPTQVHVWAPAASGHR